LRRYKRKSVEVGVFSLSAIISGGNKRQLRTTRVGVQRLDISLFRVTLRYWQRIISFCHNLTDGQTHGQTDRQNCDSNTVRCITCSRTVIKIDLITVLWDEYAQ